MNRINLPRLSTPAPASEVGYRRGKCIYKTNSNLEFEPCLGLKYFPPPQTFLLLSTARCYNLDAHVYNVTVIVNETKEGLIKFLSYLLSYRVVCHLSICICTCTCIISQASASDICPSISIFD